MSFDTFVGIDWSGAIGPRLSGIQVAVCAQGTAAPSLIMNPAGGAWRRSDIAQWLSTQLSSGRKLLIGIDFSFSFPFVDEGAYFPGCQESPALAPALWRLVDEVARGSDEFYAAPFASVRRYAPYFHRPKIRGSRFRARYRRAERRCADRGLGTPETMYKLIGPKQVGVGSLAGMRVLHYLRSKKLPLSIWPFDSRRAGSVLVDIFPRLFLRRAGLGQHKATNVAELNGALAHYASEAMHACAAVAPGRDWGDRTDALISAAALRALADEDALWHPAGLSDDVRRTEGWIFGVD